MTYDVLIIGGGPAGSSAARRLVSAGCDVAVLDKATFPRDKVCTGWITPAVVQALELNLHEYGAGRTLQPFTGFQTGGFTGHLLLTDFGRVISYGIRRCEFDDYLLRRSGAALLLGQTLKTLVRDGDEWVVNDTIRARVVVGAGGHFCPVAKRLNPEAHDENVVVAQEAEYPIDVNDGDDEATHPAWPQLFFWPDLLGYGWCVKKGGHLNIGAGHLKEGEFPRRMREFGAMLRERGLVRDVTAHRLKGHAYLLDRTSTRHVFDDGLLLVGDAAGLALAPSGEGILAAVESGLMAADAILEAGEHYRRDRLAVYGERIALRFAPRGKASAFSLVPPGIAALASRALLASPWLTRRFLLEDAFLHMRRPRISPTATSVGVSS